MEADVFNLLPPRGLDQSILLAVLIGLYTLLFFTECFGWVFAGMVVPGYLASVFIMSIGAGIAVTFEAIITIIVAKALTSFVSRTEAGTKFFGRERFFIIVLVSVVVRQNSEIWLLPALAPWIDAWFETTLAAERGLASIGLVLVPLTANMFWKVSLPRGVVQVGLPVLVVYALLYWLLLPYTNLSYSTLELTYENAALDFLASPKAYLILLVGAYLASRFNLDYGWDFNGILVPALLSLTWMDPMRILTTVIEAVLLLYATISFLKLPPVRTLNFEGPRKVVLVFTIGFFIKYGFAWFIGDSLPTQRVTDLFGFGYILPSLLAVKMLQKKTVGRILLPALQTSLLAFLLANFLGMGLQLLEPPESHRSQTAQTESSSTQMLTRTPLGAALTARTRARLDVARIEPLERSRDQLLAYRKLWKKLGKALRWDESRVRYLDRDADKLGLELREIYDREAGGAFLLLEREESMMHQEGWETALLFPGRPGPVIAVPRPHSDSYAAVAATYICRKIRCRAIIFSGVDTVAANVREGDALANKRSSFHFAHRGLGNRTPILQLRVYDDDGNDDAPTLYLKGRLSSDLNLDALWPEPIDIQWHRPPGERNVQWDTLNNLAVFRIPFQRMEQQLFLCTGAVYSQGETGLGDWLAERFDRPRTQDKVHGTSSAPCGWLAQDTATSTDGYRDFDSDGDGYDDIDDIDDIDDDDGDDGQPLTQTLLDEGASLPDMLEHIVEPFIGQHRESLCSAGSDLGEWMEHNQQFEDATPISSDHLSETELAFMREHLVEPLLDNIRDGSDLAHARIHWLSKLAYQIGYEIGQIQRCGATGQQCWVLAQHPDSEVRSSIVMVIREGDAEPIAVEVPKPDLEPGTWRLGLELWRYNNARILLMGVPINERSPSKARELRRKRNDMFHALHTTLDHALAGQDDPLVMQVRGYSSWRTIREPLVVGIGRPSLPWQNTPWGEFESSHHNTPVLREHPLMDSDLGPLDIGRLHLPTRLLPMLSEDGGILRSFGDIRFADGAEDAIGMRGRRNRQLSYTRIIGETEIALLLFSQNARHRYNRFGNDHQCRLMRRAGLTPAGEGALTGSPRAFLLNPRLGKSSVGDVGLLPKELSEILELMRRAAAFQNPYLLQKLTYLDERSDHFHVSAGTDAEFGRPYLGLEFTRADEIYRAVVFVGDFLEQSATITVGADDTERRVIRAISRRASPVVVHGVLAPDDAEPDDAEPDDAEPDDAEPGDDVQ